MAFTPETAKLAGEKSKRGPGLPTEIMKAWREGNKEQIITVLDTTMKLALSGDMDAIKTLLAYYFGKPKESVDITTGDEPVNKLIVEVIRNGGMQTK